MQPEKAMPQPMQSHSKSTQPHKFFESFLDNDLESLANELQARYQLIKNVEIRGVTPVTEADGWIDSGSVSTMKWQQYNVFQFNIPGVHNLYKALSEMVHEACNYYGIDFESQKFVVQGWFNINHTKTGKLDWHDHGPGGAPLFHGYYSVAAEPSETHYIVTNQEKRINHNVNNRAILSEMAHPHAMADWAWEGPRITIAYDVLPMEHLIPGGPGQEQHWIPLI
jgi:hypothetical protein